MTKTEFEERETEPAPVKRKRGRPFGADSKDVRELALSLTAPSVRVLKALLKSPHDNIRLAAANSLLDRGFGKPINVEERKVEQTVKHQYSDMELARRVAYTLDKAQKAQITPLQRANGSKEGGSPGCTGTGSQRHGMVHIDKSNIEAAITATFPSS